MTRAQCIIHRGRKILLVKHRYKGEEWWCLPGGAVKPDETTTDAAMRELNEECGVAGKLVRLTSRYKDNCGVDLITYLVDIGDEEPHVGYDPEFERDEQVLSGLCWLSLDEIAERDRVYLWAAGLLCVTDFLDEVSEWGDEISYPLEKSKV